MNERIKELAKQAGAQGIVNRDFVDIEKFAELIVIECIRAVRSVDLEDVEGGDEAVINACAENVKKKFGVK